MTNEERAAARKLLKECDPTGLHLGYEQQSWALGDLRVALEKALDYIDGMERRVDQLTEQQWQWQQWQQP